MNLPKAMLIVTYLLVSSRSGIADSLLVGTDLSTSQQGPELCPVVNGCQIRVQQFTLLAPVVVDNIQVAMSGPGYSGVLSPESFGIGLGSKLDVVSTVIGSGVVTADPNQYPPITELFDFAVPSLHLQPGTYYLEATGLNAMWNKASPLVTSAGAVGQGLECDDPGFNNCSDPTRWNPDLFDYAFQIDGTVDTQEPSSWFLFGTGLVAVGAIVCRKSHRLII
jgi:hypothetical protein